MLLMLQPCDKQFVGWHVCVYTFCLHIYVLERSQPSCKIFKTVPNDIFVQFMNLGEILEGLVYLFLPNIHNTMWQWQLLCSIKGNCVSLEEPYPSWGCAKMSISVEGHFVTLDNLMRSDNLWGKMMMNLKAVNCQNTFSTIFIGCPPNE